ncbi:glucan phosphoethanolaminetransferase (alkaline phosphatase superfamily) [Bradyrhizobium sp. USDA 3311]
MGNCTLVVHLTGSHHNRKNRDANRMAAKFVDELKAAGHNVEHASFTSGGREDLLNEYTGTRAAPHDD